MRGGSYTNAFVVTQSDSVDQPFDAVYVGGVGNVEIVTQNGNVVLFTATPIGHVIKLRGKRVNATNTTVLANLLIGLLGD